MVSWLAYTRAWCFCWLAEKCDFFFDLPGCDWCCYCCFALLMCEHVKRVQPSQGSRGARTASADRCRASIRKVGGHVATCLLPAACVAIFARKPCALPHMLLLLLLLLHHRLEPGCRYTTVLC